MFRVVLKMFIYASRCWNPNVAFVCIELSQLKMMSAANDGLRAFVEYCFLARAEIALSITYNVPINKHFLRKD